MRPIDNSDIRDLQTLAYQRDQLAGQQFNIEQTSFTIDSIKDTQTTVAAMKAANTQFKTEFKKMNVDEIEDTVSCGTFYTAVHLTDCCFILLCAFLISKVDDLADMMEGMNEVNDILSRSFDVGDEIDEDDLDAELEGLDDELAALDAVDEQEEQEVTATPSYISAGLNPQKESSISLPEEPHGQAQLPVDIGSANGGVPVSRSAVPYET